MPLVVQRVADQTAAAQVLVPHHHPFPCSRTVARAAQVVALAALLGAAPRTPAAMRAAQQWADSLVGGRNRCQVPALPSPLRALLATQRVVVVQVS